MSVIGDALKKLVGGKKEPAEQIPEDDQLAPYLRLAQDCLHGILPVVANPPLILKRGEIAHFASPVRVLEQRTQTTQFRAYAGTRLKVFDFPVYVGGSAPIKMSEEVMATVGRGDFIVTNQRIVLSGTKINYSIKLDKINNLKLFSDAIQIMDESKYGGRFYQMDNAPQAGIIISALIDGVQYSPLGMIQAAFDGRAETVGQFLEQGVDPNLATKEGYTALVVASDQGHADVVKLVLQYGANPDSWMGDGETALIRASLKGHIAVVKALIDGGCEVDLPNHDGATALMAAANQGHGKIVDLLLRSGANPNAKTKVGETALTLAAIEGHLEIIKRLLEAGADIEAQIDGGGTPLMVSALKGHQEAVKLLLKRGADPKTKTEQGETALSAAVAEGHTDIAKLLRKHGAK